MRELLQILQQAHRLSEAGKNFALATVVKIGGSTYRRPGARMLISDEGDRWGALSGGCLEGEVAQQALQVIETEHPQLIPFNLAEDDVVLGFGTGCDGVVHVLIQPLLHHRSPTVIDALKYCVDRRTTCLLATVIATSDESKVKLGSHLMTSEEGNMGPSTLAEGIRTEIYEKSKHYLAEELTNPQMYLWHTLAVETTDASCQVLFEFVRPPIKLYVFGEGYDAHAVVYQAALMGWEVIMVGRKPADFLQQRFPTATDWKFLMHPEEARTLIAPDRRCAALIMNHTYSRDQTIMLQLLDSNIPYIGMLGPRERTSKMRFEANVASLYDNATQQKIFGPVGLDIGTETPEEIALSAVAEIQAVLHGRTGTSLRIRKSPIHTSRTPIESVD